MLVKFIKGKVWTLLACTNQQGWKLKATNEGSCLKTMVHFLSVVCDESDLKCIKSFFSIKNIERRNIRTQIEMKSNIKIQ